MRCICVRPLTDYRCHQCNAENLAARVGTCPICIDCYSDSEAFPDMGDRAKPRGWYASHYRIDGVELEGTR
jgi:hypothetical protein